MRVKQIRPEAHTSNGVYVVLVVVPMRRSFLNENVLVAAWSEKLQDASSPHTLRSQIHSPPSPSSGKILKATDEDDSMRRSRYSAQHPMLRPAPRHFGRSTASMRGIRLLPRFPTAKLVVFATNIIGPRENNEMK